MMWAIVQTLINGVMSGGVYALIAVGLTIIFGVMKVINFAMGEYLMMGLYLTWTFQSLLGWDNYWLIIPVIPAMALISYLTFLLFIKPILGKSSETFILVTMGLSFIMQNLVQLIYGVNALTVTSEMQHETIRIGRAHV